MVIALALIAVRSVFHFFLRICPPIVGISAACVLCQCEFEMSHIYKPIRNDIYW